VQGCLHGIALGGIWLREDGGISYKYFVECLSHSNNKHPFMFSTKPGLTPDQFRWMRELRRHADDVRLPATMLSQLMSLNYVEERGGRAHLTSPGQAAFRAYSGPGISL